VVSLISIAGSNNDQKLAAIITPAAKPNIEFKIFSFIDLKKKTIAAPSAVTNQVNRVAINASNTGLYAKSPSIFLSCIDSFLVFFFHVVFDLIQQKGKNFCIYLRFLQFVFIFFRASVLKVEKFPAIFSDSS